MSFCIVCSLFCSSVFIFFLAVLYLSRFISAPLCIYGYPFPPWSHVRCVKYEHQKQLRASGVPFHVTADANGLIKSHIHTFPAGTWDIAVGISGGISCKIRNAESRSFLLVALLSLLLCISHRHFSEQMLNTLQ